MVVRELCVCVCGLCACECVCVCLCMCLYVSVCAFVCARCNDSWSSSSLFIVSVHVDPIGCKCPDVVLKSLAATVFVMACLRVLVIVRLCACV